MSVLASINRVCNDISFNIRRVNCGGCGVFAAMLGHKLSTYGVVKILVMDYETNPHTNLIWVGRNIDNSNSVFDWNDCGVEFVHIFINFRYRHHNYFIDSDGMYDSFYSYMENFSRSVWKGWLDVHTMSELAASSVGWNPQFDRSNIPIMQAIIDNAFMGA